MLEKIVPEYHSKNALVRNLFLKRLQLAVGLARPELSLGKSLKVIDLGCGEGILIKLVENNFKNVETFGLDVEPEIMRLKGGLKAKIKVADLRETGFPDNFFDTVFSMDVLEHFQKLEEPVREIERILKPSGRLIISLPVENLFYKLGRLLLKGTMSWQKGPCSSPHFHRAETIERFLESEGFEIIKKLSLPSLPFLALFHILSLKKKTA